VARRGILAGVAGAVAAVLAKARERVGQATDGSPLIAQQRGEGG